MLFSCALLMKYSSIAWVMSYSEITPSRSGRNVTMLAGVRPTIALAAAPIFSGSLVRLLIATQEGSLITMPLPLTLTKVFAVPRSIPRSSDSNPSNHFIGLKKAKFLSPSIEEFSSNVLANYNIVQISDQELSSFLLNQPCAMSYPQ
jgi:hypothetical protein